MYTKNIAFKDFKENPRNIEVNFNLTVPEVFKLLVEFKEIFTWIESIKGKDKRELPTEDVIKFYTNLEEILLESYGVPSEDGLHFRKDGKYDFKDSAMFPAIMTMFLTDPPEAIALVDGLMPKDLQELVAKADANMAELAKNPDTSEELKAEIAKLQAQLAESAPKPDAPTA